MKEPEVCTKCVVEDICECNGYYINCEHGDELFEYMEYLKDQNDGTAD